MPDILARIARYKADEVAAGKAERPIARLEAQARAAARPRGFRAALENASKGGRAALIAEVKRASPSAGEIRADFDPASIARAYEAGGATCLSVLTDGPSFQGDPSDLAAALAASALPCLRKDFLLDPWQVTQSRAMAADAVLVILALVEDSCAADLIAEAERLEMDALVEVHDDIELERALKLGSKLIGINNRDLRTFRTRLSTTLDLAPKVPREVLLAAESGIASRADVEKLEAAGARAILVGESLMRAPDPEHATRALLGR
ncbi:MAG: indole-3-glycerol phosphate synthase TrpC [Caulobacteraceae bacterium]